MKINMKYVFATLVVIMGLSIGMQIFYLATHQNALFGPETYGYWLEVDLTNMLLMPFTYIVLHNFILLYMGIGMMLMIMLRAQGIERLYFSGMALLLACQAISWYQIGEPASNINVLYMMLALFPLIILMMSNMKEQHASFFKLKGKCLKITLAVGAIGLAHLSFMVSAMLDSERLILETKNEATLSSTLPKISEKPLP